MKVNNHFDSPFTDQQCFLRQMRLSHVPRWGIIDMAKEQSVAEHCFNVAMLAGFLWDRFGTLDQYIDRRGIVYLALIHEESEIFTGDIPTPAKDNSPKGSGPIYDLIKLADSIEAYLFSIKYCRDSEKVKNWLLVGLRNDIESRCIRLDINFDDIEQELMEII